MTAETASLKPLPGLGLLSRSWLALALIAATALLIYANIYDAPFVFDDIPQIVEKRAIRDLRAYASWQALRYPRVLVDFTFALNYRLGKIDVFGFHLFNVLVHVLNGFLVYFLSRAVLTRLAAMTGGERGLSLSARAPLIALAAALLFTSHPLQTQAVTYTVQRYTSMAAFFYLASVLCYLRTRSLQLGKPRTALGLPGIAAGFGLTGLCGFLAFLCKQSAASLPLAILLVEYFCFDRSRQGWQRKLLWLLPGCLVFLVFILYVSGAFRGAGGGFGKLLEDVSRLAQETDRVGRWTYLCTQFNVLLIYIRLLFLPIGQNLDYLYPFKKGFWDGLTPLSFLAVGVLLALALALRNRRPVAAFGILWFFVTLAVESSVIPIRDALFEHRLYLPLWGPSLAIAAGLLATGPGGKAYPMRMAFCCALVIACGLAAHARNGVYRDEVRLFSDVVAKSPQNYRGYYNLGAALERQGRFEDALTQYQKVLDLRPGYPRALASLAGVLNSLGRYEEAGRHARAALERDPELSTARISLAVALGRQGRPQGEAEQLNEALRQAPRDVDALVNAGVALARRGKLSEAAEHFSRALALRPDAFKVRYNLAMVLERQGKLEEAAQHYQAALRIDPQSAPAHHNLAVVLVRLGRAEEAVEHFVFGVAEEKQ